MGYLQNFIKIKGADLKAASNKDVFSFSGLAAGFLVLRLSLCPKPFLQS